MDDLKVEFWLKWQVIVVKYLMKFKNCWNFFDDVEIVAKIAPNDDWNAKIDQNDGWNAKIAQNEQSGQLGGVFDLFSPSFFIFRN